MGALVKARIKRKIWDRDNYVCFYCKRNLKKAFRSYQHSPYSPIQFKNCPITVDHVVARCNGGTNVQENLVTACLKCNHLKGKKEEPIHLNRLDK